MKNFGYIEPQIKEEDFILGGGKLPDENLRPNGQWLDVLPSDESQAKRGIDVQNCTGFGWNNVIEMYIRAKFFLETNNSDRYTGISAGTYPPGNDPSTVIESIRINAGLIAEELLPFIEGMTVDEYYSPKPLPDKYTDQGKEWLKKYYLRHEWVFDNFADEDGRKRALMESLKHSPIAIAVNAWNDENGIYVRKGVDTHWTASVGYKENEYWLILDSYPPYLKKLDWNFGFRRAKRIYIGVQEEPKQKEDYLTYLIEYVQLAVFSFQEAISRLFAPKKAEVMSPIPEGVKPVITQPAAIVSVPVVNKPKVTDWAMAIQEHEGYWIASRSYRNRNPGNIKFTEFGKDVLGMIDKDKDNFGIFATYETGFKGLVKFLTYAIQDRLRSYNSKMTLAQFFSVYAPSSDGNSPINYAKTVAKKTCLSINSKINEFVV